MKRHLFAAGVVGIGALWFSGCAPKIIAKAEPAPAAMPEKARIRTLEWKPTMTQQDFDLAQLSVYSSLPVALLSVNDPRDDPRLIGKAYEDRQARTTLVPLATKVNVAKWCKSAFEKVFQVTGIQSDEKKGKLRLDVEISDFSIFDDFTQTGTIALRITAHTDQDLLIWEGQIKGTSDLYVHETNSDGISECLSNTVMMTVYNMFTDQSFRDAVVKAFE